MGPRVGIFLSPLNTNDGFYLSHMGSDVGQIFPTASLHRDHSILYALVCEKEKAIGDLEGRIFQSYPHTKNGLFFLFTTVFIFINLSILKIAPRSP